ncbi:MAG: hypothetical protein OXE94_12290 [Aestuariivita sp.]|nr:hypothetical protein [Aestuariivita sp.]MCY4201321.1 hypothetical protein [Aestuariivita sp.]MCY4289456.1 hypothetical protein [Aestuariivita sp.]MCY4347337.1 hypothetical protein [Aestuariivita sp.]
MNLVILFVQVWGGIGAVVALVFLIFGISRIDEDARGALSFRPLLIPGILIIWPLVIWRWWQLTGTTTTSVTRSAPRESHAIVAVVLAVIVSATLFTTEAIRQEWPSHLAPIRLDQAQ